MDRLRSVLPDARLLRYQQACHGRGVDPISLYLWAGSVALAMFDDLSHLEVVMRSKMAESLAATYGLRWYERHDVLDSDSLKLVGKAWTQSGLSTLEAPESVIHGKVVASLMFGFWVKILGKGTYYVDARSRPPIRERRIYDTILWKPALRTAFPNVGDFERSKVEGLARVVQTVRNRIAHHEHIVWGIGLPGQVRDGIPVRLSVCEAQETMLALAGCIDQGLEGWLRENSRVEERIRNCPLPDHEQLLLVRRD